MKKLISYLVIGLSILVTGCFNSLDPTPKNTGDLPAFAVAASYNEYKISPHDTDPAINATADSHFSYLDSRLAPKAKLVIFFGGTGSVASSYHMFCRQAAALGYHVINLNYPNSVTTRVCKDKADTACFTKFHQEIIFGKDGSPYVNVNISNSIANRITKLLQYLHRNHPLEKWNQFYTTNGLNYPRILFSGHSQGGGHAAYFGYKFPVAKVIMFSSPNDYSEKYGRVASWCKATFATTSNRFFGLIHKRDEIVPVSEQYALWKAMRMLVASDTSSADKSTFNRYRALYTNFEPNPSAGNLKLKHNVPVMDVVIPNGANGEQLKKVWRYFLLN